MKPALRRASAHGDPRTRWKFKWIYRYADRAYVWGIGFIITGHKCRKVNVNQRRFPTSICKFKQVLIYAKKNANSIHRGPHVNVEVLLLLSNVIEHEKRLAVSMKKFLYKQKRQNTLLFQFVVSCSRHKSSCLEW